ncbi:MAG TPA: hypothetical protein VEC35_09755 [Noviherbaspirillum sp.]|nr:hypothetical protein [Noviherbaspirillum sp.]
MQIKALPIEGSETEGKLDDIAELSLGPSGLRVVIGRLMDDDSYTYLEVFFSSPRGFRYLDEGDLLRYWRSDELSPRKHSIFEIAAGGWMEQERQTAGMLDTTAAVGWYREWFIITANGRLNVIAGEPPLLRKI